MVIGSLKQLGEGEYKNSLISSDMFDGFRVVDRCDIDVMNCLKKIQTIYKCKKRLKFMNLVDFEVMPPEVS